MVSRRELIQRVVFSHRDEGGAGLRGDVEGAGRIGELDASILELPAELEVDVLLAIHEFRVVCAQHVVDNLELVGRVAERLEMGTVEPRFVASSMMRRTMPGISSRCSTDV